MSKFLLNSYNTREAKEIVLFNIIPPIVTKDLVKLITKYLIILDIEFSIEDKDANEIQRLEDRNTWLSLKRPTTDNPRLHLKTKYTLPRVQQHNGDLQSSIFVTLKSEFAPTQVKI
jgi:hypothetical protein